MAVAGLTGQRSLNFESISRAIEIRRVRMFLSAERTWKITIVKIHVPNSAMV